MAVEFLEHHELHCLECQKITLHALAVLNKVEEFRCLWCDQLYYLNRRQDQIWHANYMYHTHPMPRTILRRMSPNNVLVVGELSS